MYPTWVPSAVCCAGRLRWEPQGFLLERESTESYVSQVWLRAGEEIPVTPRRRKLLGLASIAILALGACSEAGGSGDQAGTPEVYKIGVAAALTGTGVECCGTPYVNGIELAVKEINDDGGINGVPIELVIEDHKGEATAGALVMQKFASESVPVVLSSFSQVVAAQAPIAERNGILLLNPAGGSASISEAGSTVYTTRSFGGRQDEVLFQYLLEEGVERPAIVAIDVERGIDARDVWSGLIDEDDLTKAAEELYPAETTNFASYIARTKAANPDAILLAPQAQDGGIFVKQAQSQGLNVPIYSTTAFDDPTVVETAGEAATGLVYASMRFNGSDPPTDVQASFVEDYENEFGNVPNVFSAMNYDAIKAILVPTIETAIERDFGYTGEGLIRAMLELGTFEEGATGEGTLDVSSRDMILPQAVYRIESDGSRTEVLVVEPEAG